MDLIDGHGSVVQQNRLKRIENQFTTRGRAQLLPRPYDINVAGASAEAVARAVVECIARNDALTSTPSLGPAGPGMNYGLVAAEDCVEIVSADSPVDSPDEVFDLSDPHRPLVRAAVAPSADGCVIRLLVEHLVWDGGSLGPFLTQLAHAADGGPIQPPSYQDFVRREASFLASGRGARAFEWWATALAGTVPFPPLHLPPGEGESGVAWMRYSAERPNDSRRSATVAWLSTIYQTMWALGMDDPVVHMTFANRTQRADLQCVGWFAHSLPLRLARADGQPVYDRVGRLVGSALAHQSIPLPLLTARLQEGTFGRSTRRPRLHFAYWPRHNSGTSVSAGGVDFSVPGGGDVEDDLRESPVQSDVSFDVFETAAGVECVLRFNPGEVATAWAMQAARAWQLFVEEGVAPVRQAVEGPVHASDLNAFPNRGSDHAAPAR